MFFWHANPKPAEWRGGRDVRATLAVFCIGLAVVSALGLAWGPDEPWSQPSQNDPFMDRFLKRATTSPNAELEIELLRNRDNHTEGRISKEASDKNERELLTKIANRDAREAEEKRIWDERRRFEQAERR